MNLLFIEAYCCIKATLTIMQFTEYQYNTTEILPVWFCLYSEYKKYSHPC